MNNPIDTRTTEALISARIESINATRRGPATTPTPVEVSVVAATGRHVMPLVNSLGLALIKTGAWLVGARVQLNVRELAR